VIAYFDCFSGASGDMLLGALLDAGLSLDDLEADLSRLAVGGYRLAAERVTRRGLTGTHLRVRESAGGAGDRPARHPSDVEAIIGGSGLPRRVVERSLAVFRRIARIEAGIHGTSVEEVHFHEIGAVDSLVDIVGFAAGLERLGVDQIYASALPLGSGTVETEHGRLPVPAPATLALLAEVGAPTLPGPGEGELVTPTGAGLLAELATFRRPAMAVKRTGYGFGTRDYPWANALRVWLGKPLVTAEGPEADDVVELACNLDNASGEVLGYVLERLLAAGALDAWFTPIQMKKNRPAVKLSVLARPEDQARLAGLLLEETPTLGVRHQALSRTVAGREMRAVETPWGRVQVKVKLLAGRPVAFAPEYDDCARLAAAAGVPLGQVMEAARQAAQAR
jgi:pyridinium-3,5-bisthiocarboxylic acid mononucleotide nickel chelatase